MSLWRQRRRTPDFTAQRRRMVESHLRGRGIRDERVLAAMARIPREAYVPIAWRSQAYADQPLPIGEGQTISQPYIVALMTEALEVFEGAEVLELGTGSGYQTAILAAMGATVWTVERSGVLSAAARSRLAEQGVQRVRCIRGDGTIGWAPEAPYDRILATGSLPSIPESLVAQLREGGIFVGPIGSQAEQMLQWMSYHSSGRRCRDLGPCRFVPLVGDAGWREADLGIR